MDASEEGRYVNTTHAHHGMRGTDLPEMPTGTVWKAGGTAEVAWNVRFNTEEAVSCSLGDALVLAPTLTQCPDDVWLHPQTLIDCAPLPSH